MKTRIVIFLVLITGLLGVQGCCAGGTWFPETDKRERKQSSLKKNNECEDTGGLGHLVCGILDACIND